MPLDGRWLLARGVVLASASWLLACAPIDHPVDPPAGLADVPSWVLEWESSARASCRASPSLEMSVDDLAVVRARADRWLADGLVCQAAALWLEAGVRYQASDARLGRSALEQALDIALQGDDIELLATITDRLKTLESREQNLARAVELAAASQYLWHHAGRPRDVLRNRYEYALLVFRMGRLDLAESELLEVLAAIQQAPARHRDLLGPTLTILGRIAITWRDFERAEDRLSQALTARGPEPTAGRAATLDAMTRVRIEQHRFAEAGELAATVLDISTGDPRRESNALATLGEIELGLGNPQRAIDLARMARALLRGSRAEDPNLELHTLHIEALAYRSMDSDLADGRTQALLARVEAFRQSEPGDLLISYVEYRRRYFTSWVEYLTGQERWQEAFEAAERTRARSFLDRVVWPPAELRKRVPSSLVDRERELTSQLSDAARAIESTTHPAATDQLASRVRKLRLALIANETDMRAAVGTIVREPVDLAMARHLLDRQTVLLAFWLGEDESMVWILDRGELTVVRALPSRHALERSIRTLRRLVAREQASRAAIDGELNALSAALLAPVVATLDTMPATLVVVPDGALAELPFPALPWPIDGEAEAFLAESVPVVIAHSLSIVAAIRERQTLRTVFPQYTLTAVGDPVYSADDPRLRLKAAVAPAPTNAFAHQRLTWSGWELSRLERRLAPEEVQVFAGLDASKSQLVDGCASQSRFVHIGAHAELDRDAPALSAIYLSAFDSQGRASDGSLRLTEMEQLELSAELVVLAACKSAAGRTYSSEGAVALPRALLMAGATTVLASLWPIEDEPTALFTDRFWEGLIEGGLPAPIALQEAQLALIHSRRWHHPKHWAGFVLLGDWRAQDALLSTGPLER